MTYQDFEFLQKVLPDRGDSYLTPRDQDFFPPVFSLMWCAKIDRQMTGTYVSLYFVKIQTTPIKDVLKM